MKELVIHHELINKEVIEKLQIICPFDAFSLENGRLGVNAACKMCGLCVKKGPAGAVTLEEKAPSAGIDKSLWRGITVFADTTEGRIHPVTFELLGKARDLAAAVGHPVYALLMGSGNQAVAQELLHYGADEVFVYDNPLLETFLIEPFTAAAADFIDKIKPCAMLVGGTNAGRSLAPRIAARVKTGLTADCTSLEIKPNTDLVQIRPAFGGNIMARIVTPNNRPQLCTARYKIFSALPKQSPAGGKITMMKIDKDILQSRVVVLQTTTKELGIDLTVAEVIVAAGRGIKNKKDLELVKELAGLMQAQFACTRPLVEAGWMDPRRQIGLSGRTVSPKLIITVGISGSVQFAAGMKGSQTIIAINNDKNASIFNIAHYAVIGDLYEVVPRLMQKIKDSREITG
jgi:electron transfer flavoprotein alpha subunit